MCAPCRARHEPPVFLSAGGETYHRKPTCWACEWGQSRVPAAKSHAIRKVGRLHAIAIGRVPCEACYLPPAVAG
jgi:hypothetical protein